MKIPNITVLQYTEIPDKDEIDYVIKYYTRAENYFKIEPLNTFGFGLVKDFQQSTQNDMTFQTLFEFIELFAKVNIKTIYKCKLIDILHFKNYLLEEITNINNAEIKHLSGKYSEMQIDSGINKFDELGIYTQFSELAGGDVTKIEQVRNTPYNICFLELKYRTLSNEFRKQWNNLNL